LTRTLQLIASKFSLGRKIQKEAIVLKFNIIFLNVSTDKIALQRARIDYANSPTDIKHQM
jgi:hypothetical protein